MRRQKEVSISVLDSRARWFESVPERSNAKDPAPLKVKEVWVEERRYIVCLNEEERRKDAHDRAQVVRGLEALQQVEATFQDKRFLLRSRFSGEASAALRELP
jgi:hypothetical protein